MFYGKFPDERKKQFKEALHNFSGMFKRVYAQDNMIVFNRNLSFFSHDKKFEAAFHKNAHTEQEKSLAWRLHTLCWAAKLALKVPGDFVECGVWKGFSFRVVTDYLDFGHVPKSLYLYDTYEGIPQAYNSENRSNRAYANAENVHAEVVARFGAMPNVKVVQGTVTKPN
jgi:O-methyltransferase